MNHVINDVLVNYIKSVNGEQVLQLLGKSFLDDEIIILSPVLGGKDVKEAIIEGFQNSSSNTQNLHKNFLGQTHTIASLYDEHKREAKKLFQLTLSLCLLFFILLAVIFLFTRL